MSATIRLFNHTERLVQYDVDGRQLCFMGEIDADPEDPMCALAVEMGYVTVLTPQEPVQMANSFEAAAPPPPEIVEAVEPIELAEPADATDVAEEPKATSRKKTTTQASKES